MQSRTEFYINLLSDTNPNVRKKAAQSLGQLGDTSCLFLLNDALKLETDACAELRSADLLASIQEAIAKLQA